MGSTRNEPHNTRLAGFYGVTVNPASSLFPSFKRQFHASLAVGPGFIDIQSKTKSDQFARIDVSRLNQKPFIRSGQSAVVVLRNRSISGGNWYEISIKAQSSNMAANLCSMILALAWPTKDGAAPPDTPANVALPSLPPSVSPSIVIPPPKIKKASQPRNYRSLSLIRPPPIISALLTPRSLDDDVLLMNNNLKMRVRVNKERPSATTVIASPGSITNHRPIRVKREPGEIGRDGEIGSSYQAPPPTPSAVDLERSSASQSAARILQFGPPPSDELEQQSMNSGASSPFHMQRLLNKQQMQHLQQPQSPLGQMNTTGASSQMENAAPESSVLQTPVQSPSVQQLLQQLLNPNPPTPQQSLLQQFQAAQQMQQQQQSPLLPTPFNGGMQGLFGNSSTGSTGGGSFDMNFGGFSGGGAFGSPSAFPLAGDDQRSDYRRFAAEFEKLAARVALMPPEKRRNMMNIVSAMTNMVCQEI